MGEKQLIRLQQTSRKLLYALL